MNKKLKTFAAAVVLLAAVAAGLVYWAPWKTQGPGEGFVSGNGRIEATEVAVATKQAGRVIDILVGEGDFVTAGQPVARIRSTACRPSATRPWLACSRPSWL